MVKVNESQDTETVHKGPKITNVISLNEDSNVLKQPFNENLAPMPKIIEHVNAKYTCKYCEKSYGYLSNLKAHIKLIHEGIRILCKFCNRSFTRKSSLKKHIDRIHQGIYEPKNDAELFEPPTSVSNVNSENTLWQNSSQEIIRQDPQFHEDTQTIKSQSKHKCNFCEEVFGNDLNNSFLFEGCFLP